MWKLIFKNLWSRRSRNGWIFVELVIVTIILFVLVDKLAVSLYDSSLPLGYDADRLCVVTVGGLKKSHPKFVKERHDSTSRVDDVMFLKNKIKSMPEVENATVSMWQYIHCPGGNSNQMASGDAAKDSVNITTLITYNFHPGQNFFETYGIKAVEGSPSAEELSKMSYADNDVVLTKSYVDRFYPGENVVGKTVFTTDWDWTDNIQYRVVGVVEDMRFRSSYRVGDMAFFPTTKYYFYFMATFVVRLKEGVDPAAFAADLNKRKSSEFVAGNMYVKSAQPLNDMITLIEQDSGVTSQRRLQMALCLFFLINLCLGVIGTFWLQTRTRTEEAGVMRSFGARRWDIRRMLLGEGLVLSTLSVLVGCLIYLQVALKNGLYENPIKFFTLEVLDSWVTHFGEHFIIISLLCYVVITFTVLVGIYLPARNISNVNPIDALRDE